MLVKKLIKYLKNQIKKYQKKKKLISKLKKFQLMQMKKDYMLQIFLILVLNKN